MLPHKIPPSQSQHQNKLSAPLQDKRQDSAGQASSSPFVASAFSPDQSNDTNFRKRLKISSIPMQDRQRFISRNADSQNLNNAAANAACIKEWAHWCRSGALNSTEQRENAFNKIVDYINSSDCPKPTLNLSDLGLNSELPKLPPELKNLIITGNGDFRFSEFPEDLEEMDVSRNMNLESHGFFHKNIKKLSLRGFHKLPKPLPDALRHLTFSGSYNPVKLGLLFESPPINFALRRTKLSTLTISDCVLGSLHLPDTLEELSVNESYLTNIPSPVPQGLRKAIFSGIWDFEDDLESTVFPPSMIWLEFSDIYLYNIPWSSLKELAPECEIVFRRCPLKIADVVGAENKIKDGKYKGPKITFDYSDSDDSTQSDNSTQPLWSCGSEESDSYDSSEDEGSIHDSGRSNINRTMGNNAKPSSKERAT